ncbi:hypothetical protein [uncultured Paludibaculum sp.]|uniref:hypothetical protein n=1 Tax=uncultured Paludibaculum sp. TaxID=1765020 RepID=UPI002AAA94A0|nr:hypothetical protein [uncultured Paludibaculum sp.]
MGKTRLVFEAIRQSPGASELTILTDDDDRATEVARWLVNHGEMTAVLIADECPVEGREKLRRILRGSESRVRAVAIDNTGEPTPGGSPEIWLEKIDGRSTEEILAQNFGAVPAERRRAYADLSGGYVRLAADLCRHDHQMHLAGTIAPARLQLDSYYRSRLSDTDRHVVEAVSLLQRVGCDDDVTEELNQLAALTGIAPQTVRDAAQRLKNSPGFLARTPRYVYVTPQIVAEIAFGHAWKRWAEANRASFLDHFPPSLLNSFETRVRGLMDQEVRSFVSAHFCARVANLTPADLANTDRVNQLLSLLETNPSAYLPQLERLVRESSHAELLAQGEHPLGTRGTRRGIVWAAERLAAFPEYFTSAEYILRRLAMAESEPRIGNNATGIWRQLFRVWLSGASVPFLARFEIYKQVLFSDETAERDLALGGLERMWDTRVSRMGGGSVVAGRIPPSDWTPESREEAAACLAAAFDLLERMLSSGKPLVDAAWSYFVGQLTALLGYGELSNLEALLAKFPLPEPLLAPWLEKIDDYLQYECGDLVSSKRSHSAYCERVRAWRNRMSPTDFVGRLRAVVGKDIWHHSIRERASVGGSEIDMIADELVGTVGLLEESFAFLCSTDARSAVSLGAALGRRDISGSFLEPILAAARHFRAAALLRGYVTGLTAASPGHEAKINQVLDLLEVEDAPIAVEMILGALEVTDPAARIVRMISQGKLGLESMQFLLYGKTLQRLTSAQFYDTIGVFDHIDTSPDELNIGCDIIDSWLRTDDSNSTIDPIDSDTIDRILSILRKSASTETRGDFGWSEALTRLAQEVPAEVAAIAATAVLGDDYEKQRHGATILANLAVTYPDVVMNEIGPRMLDSGVGWRWNAESHKQIFCALPADTVQTWLDGVGLSGARRIARHLPSPFIDSEGNAVVPAVTEKVLAMYGDDETVFGEFCAGQHHREVMIGDLAAAYEGFARAAQPFLNHPARVVQRWAANEIASSRFWAGRWRKDTESERFER